MVNVHKQREVFGYVILIALKTNCKRYHPCLTVMRFVFLSLDVMPNGQPEGEWTAIT